MEDSEHRALAAATYNRCWELLDAPTRTSETDRDLLTAAFASRHHWSMVGGVEQQICADWMVARAFSSLGEGRLAVDFAQRAYDVAQHSSVPDWLLASTAEGLARAYAASAMVEQRDAWCVIAGRLVDAIADDEDRTLIVSQLMTVPR